MYPVISTCRFFSDKADNPIVPLNSLVEGSLLLALKRRLKQLVLTRLDPVLP